MTEDAFGFSAARRRTEEKLRSISPGEGGHPTAPLDRIDAAGEAHGFVQRERPQTVLQRRRKEIGPTVAINMRVPEQVAVTFIEFCERHRYSYWEGVQELMKRAGVS